ncbi:MAG: sigma-70 family RNA polymerase sigma factor [bacterium]|nr:sigma-70 family RNA polymerase sigma factor [bacterium]
MAFGPDVDEVTQIVAEKLIRKWSEPHVAAARTRGAAAWHAYIAKAARYAYHDLGRSRSRDLERSRRTTLGTDGEPLHPRPGVLRRQHHQASDADRYLARLAIVEMIQELPLRRRQRHVLALHFIDGLSTREIADRLGLSIGTVNQDKREGVATIRSAIGGDG